jgi:hypothetical protein
MDKKTVYQPDDDLVRVGIFETKLSLEVVQELNRRKIIHRLDELDNHLTELSALPSSSTEAKEVLDEIKRKHKRIRL